MRPSCNHVIACCVRIQETTSILSKAWFYHYSGLHKVGCFCQSGKSFSSKHWAGKMGAYWAMPVSAVQEAALLNIAESPPPLQSQSQLAKPTWLSFGNLFAWMIEWQPRKPSKNGGPVAKSFISLASLNSSGSFCKAVTLLKITQSKGPAR